MSQEHYYGPTVIDMAYEIIRKEDELLLLREENKRLKEIEQKYYTLLDKSLKQTQQLTGAVLEVMRIPGVADVLDAKGEFKNGD